MPSPHFVSTATLALHWTLAIGLSARVIMHRRPVGVSLAWTTVLLAVPFVGAGMYLLFGEKRLARRRRRHWAQIAPLYHDWQASLRKRFPTDPTAAGPAYEHVARQAESTVGFGLLPAGDLRLLTDFQTIFDAIIEDIDDAKRNCHLEFYIWTEGGRADDVVEALIRAAKRGVICRLALDALGSKAFLRSARASRMKDAGVDIIAILPASVWSMAFIRMDLRNHRKIIAIDRRVAYTGSQNLVDPRFFKQSSGVGQWVDAMIRIEGPVVEALGGTFVLDWTLESGSEIATRKDLDQLERESMALQPPRTGQWVQTVPSGPEFTPHAIQQLILTAIYSARRELILTSPYFVLDEAVLTAVVSSARRGVSVTIVVPARVDSLLVRYASRSQFDDLLAVNARIMQFGDGLLHTKSITIDGEMSIFGSVNLDMRSLFINFEISLFLYDTEFTARLRELQLDYVRRSEPLDRQEWNQRPARERFFENTMRLVGPLL